MASSSTMIQSIRRYWNRNKTQFSTLKESLFKVELECLEDGTFEGMVFEQCLDYVVCSEDPPAVEFATMTSPTTPPGVWTDKIGVM